MWRQTHLARRTASLCRHKVTLQNPCSLSQVLLDSPHQSVFLHSRELSSHSSKWGFVKFGSFQLLRPFSSDSVTENVEEPDLVSDLNVDENPDVVSSESVENEGDSAEKWELGGDDEGVIGENGVVTEDEEIVENDVERVENLLSLLQSSSGGGVNESFGDRLDEMRLVLGEEFVLSVIGTPHIPGENLVAFYDWCLGKRGFYATKQALDMLVRVVCGEGNKYSAYKLWDLFKEVGKKEGTLSTEILNELISLFSKIGKGKAAYEVFEKFEEFGCAPDAETFYNTTEALFKRSIFDFAATVSQKMVSMEMLPDAEKIGNLIYYLCKGKKSRDAHSVYLLAKEKNKCPPKSSINFLINSLCFLPKKDKTATRDDTDKLYRENIYFALEILDNFSDEDRKLAAVQPFSSVCQALCKIGDVDKAKGLLFSMIKSGPPPCNAIFNAIINGLSKADENLEAINLLKVMEERGLRPDMYAYTVIMSSYAKGGVMSAARQLLEEAKQRHAKLTPVIYHTMIRGYCKLEQFDEAVKLLAEMKDYGVEANADEYNKLIQSLCLNVLDWELAEKLVEEMKEKGLHLNGVTRGLISAVKKLEEEGKETQEVNVGM